MPTVICLPLEKIHLPRAYTSFAIFTNLCVFLPSSWFLHYVHHSFFFNTKPHVSEFVGVPRSYLFSIQLAHDNMLRIEWPRFYSACSRRRLWRRLLQRPLHHTWLPAPPDRLLYHYREHCISGADSLHVFALLWNGLTTYLALKSHSASLCLVQVQIINRFRRACTTRKMSVQIVGGPFNLTKAMNKAHISALSVALCTSWSAGILPYEAYHGSSPPSTSSYTTAHPHATYVLTILSKICLLRCSFERRKDLFFTFLIQRISPHADDACCFLLFDCQGKHIVRFPNVRTCLSILHKRMFDVFSVALAWHKRHVASLVHPKRCCCWMRRSAMYKPRHCACFHAPSLAPLCMSSQRFFYWL